MNLELDIRVRLSLYWLIIMINMIYNDIFSIIVEIVNGGAINIPGDVTIVMTIAAVLTNIPIFMILLSRILNDKFNRIANIGAGFFTIIYVIGGGSTAPHYIIIAGIEIILAILIIITAWSWD